MTETANAGWDRANPLSGVQVLVEDLRKLGPDRSLGALMRIITDAAVHGANGATAAGLTTRSGDGYRTLAPTNDLPIAVDALQYEHGGPCVDALVGDESVVHVTDLRSDHRWPLFTAAAVEHTPVLGVLSYRLGLGTGDASASLNLYADKPHAFDDDDVRAGEHLAAYAAVMLAYAQQEEKARNLERALDTSREIGAAIGILMTRHLVSREQAFDLLRIASQHSHRKLRDIAGDVLERGDLAP